jgi:hypothetical protein
MAGAMIRPTHHAMEESVKGLLGLVAIIVGLSGGAAMAQETWNAVATNFHGVDGIVWGAESEDTAKQAAIDQCGQDGCQSILQTQMPCMSVAYTDDQGGYYGYAQGSTKLGSGNIALGYCQDGGYEGCEVIINQCVADAPAQTTTNDTPAPSTGKTKTKG